MKKLVSFDLDMTLLDHETYRIPDSAMEALRRLKEQGSLVVLATGRDMDNHYSREFKEIVGADAVIHLNGTKITVGDELIYEHWMDSGLLERVLRFAEEHGAAVGVTVGDDDYYTNPAAVTAHDMARWGESGRHFKNPWELLDMGVRTLAYIGEPDGAKKLEDAFPELKLPLFAGRQGADVIEKISSKAQGLKRLCEYFGVRLQDTYAFGDSMNDIEIIKLAGTGIAMGNALEELKEAADYVTADIGDDGIYKACEYFGLI